MRTFASRLPLPGVEIMQTIQPLLNFWKIIFLTGLDFETIQQRLVGEGRSALKTNFADFKVLRRCPGSAGCRKIRQRADYG